MPTTNWDLPVNYRGKGEKERYTHLNVEYQILAKRDKKAFLGDQCKEIEENNRMGKTRDLFKCTRQVTNKVHSALMSSSREVALGP